MANNKGKTYVPKDLDELASLGTHSLGMSSPRMTQGKVIKDSSGARSVVSTGPADRDVYHGKSFGKDGKAFINSKIVGSPVRKDKVPMHVRESLAKKRREAKFRLTCSEWTGTDLTCQLCEDCGLVPTLKYSMDHLYSMASTY